MGDFGVLPAEWERHNSVNEVSSSNGYVKDLSFGADSQLFVRFDVMPEAVWHEIDGERVVKEITKHEYVWIQRPGDKLQIYHQRAKRRHIRRFPKHYEAFKSGKSQGMLGLPLANWDYQLSNADIQTLRLMGIEYVHQLATLPDTMLPVIGLSGKIWRAAAQVTMQEFGEKQAKTEMQLELNERDRHIAELREEANGSKAEVEALKEEMRQMQKLLMVREESRAKENKESAEKFEGLVTETKKTKNKKVILGDTTNV